MFPLKCVSGGRKVMGQNGVAERTASKHQRTWGSEGSWANRELNDLEPFPSSLWALLPLVYIRKDLQWVSALYSELSQRGYFKSNTSSFQAVSLVRKITFTRKSAMLMSSWKFSHHMCGNVCLQTRMDTQETQKRFLKASTLEFSFLLVEGTLAMNSLLKKKKKRTRGKTHSRRPFLHCLLFSLEMEDFPYFLALHDSLEEDTDARGHNEVEVIYTI